MPSGAVSEQDV